MEKITPPYLEENKQETFLYSQDEELYRKYLLDKLTKARDNREASQIEFDDCGYTAHYDTNYKTGNSYIRKKKNKEDSRIVTGTTLEKENTFLSAILNYNFEPSIKAFDKMDLPLNGLGDKLESLVKKSRSIEQYEDKRPLFYKEGADQGTWFAEEVWVEEWKIQKKLKDIDYTKVDVKKIKWETTRERKIIGAQANLIPGTGVYLGNIKQFFMHKQPYVFTRDVISYDEARACYGEYDRFEYVSRTLKTTDTYNDSQVRKWNLEELEDGMVEVVKYQDKYNNEYMLMLNGVMMLPVGFPLTAISPSGEYTLVKGDIEPISEFFAYSKSYPAKTKVPQEILDDTIRTMVLRMRQLLEPPLANNTSTVLSRKIFYPGNITPDINPNQIQKILGENNQIGAGEFQVFNLVKQIVDEMTTSPIMSGQAAGGRATATEVMQMKQQSMMKLGYAIFGILAFERNLAWLRLYNILANYTKPIDTKINDITGQLEDVYMSVTSTESDENGSFTRVIDFNPQGLEKSQEQVDAEAKIMSTPKNEIQKVYMNPKIISENFLKWNFVIDVTPTPKDSSELEISLFIEKVMKAKQIFGPQSTNDPYLRNRLAVMSKEDPEQFWAKQPTQPIGVPGLPPAGQTPLNDQIMKGIAKPSLSPMAQQ